MKYVLILVCLVVAVLLTWFTITGKDWKEGISENSGQELLFREVSASAGLAQKIDNRAFGQYRLIETMGTGVAHIDYDNDGWLDIALGQGGRLPGDRKAPGLEPALYRNNRDGTFSDVSVSAGFQCGVYSQGMAVGDYDGDGFDDLFYAGFNSSVLFKNNGDGTFSDVTESAGVRGSGWASSCAFADLNGDGLLDLYVARYLKDTIDEFGRPTKKCPGHQGSPGYCPPFAHEPETDILYRNNGDGTFTDVSEEAGLNAKPAPGLGVVIADFDGDGLIDVFVANDMKPNQFWRNNGDMRFSEQGQLAGLAVGENGETRAGMGIAAGDCNHDGMIDLLVTNFQDEPNNLYLQESPGLFAVKTAMAGLSVPSMKVLGFGTAFIDVDNDSHLDLVVANGHINDFEAVKVPYRQSPQLFINDGKGFFGDVSQSAGEYFEKKWLGRGLAFGDLDNDGDIDIVVTQLGGPPSLLMNESRRMGNHVTIEIATDTPHRDPTGTIAKIRVGEQSIVRHCYAGSSYLSSHDRRLLVGIGNQTEAILESITWPGGKVEMMQEKLESGQRYRLIQGKPLMRATSNEASTLASPISTDVK